MEEDASVSELPVGPRHRECHPLVHVLLVDGLGASHWDKHFEEPTPDVHGRVVEIGVR